MKKAYLLGIGGAGMAGLSEYLTEKGVSVQGHDRAHSVTVQHLEQKGIPVHISPNPNHLKYQDFCVYSTALASNHPLLQKAKQTLPTYSRGEMMGEIAKEHNRVVGVAGTHGKTTTVGMLTQIIKKQGLDPSVLIGGHLPAINGYGHYGSSSLLICEACEFKENFLHLFPTLGIVLNMDKDHLDCYKDMQGLTAGFTQFARQCRAILINGDDPLCQTLAKNHPRSITFGRNHGVDLQGTNLREEKGFFSFTLVHKGVPLEEITLSVPGEHQVTNALAAAGAALSLGIPLDAIVKGLLEFHGVKRRFDIVYQDDFLTIADDYAHHPTEIAATLKTAKAMGFSRITALFQPFTYSRTRLLAEEFANALSLADRVILAPVMAGREPPEQAVSSALIGQYLRKVTLCQSLSHCGAVALSKAKKGELIITLGCGNVNECAAEMAVLCKNKKKQA